MSLVLRTLYSYLNQSFPPKPTFTTDDIPDLTGKIAIVTGGNAGIGREIVTELLKHNAKVYLAARNQEKATRAIEELKEETGKEAIWLPLNLASLKSVKGAAEEFSSKETQLHILYNNAGVMAPPIDQLTEDGYDMQFGTNVLGHFYFTQLLLPIILATSTPEEKPRILTTSSVMHYTATSFLGSGLDFNTFKDSPKRRKKLVSWLYGQSKLGNMVFAQELARRHGDKIVSIGVNPGNLNTNLPQYLNRVEGFLLGLILYPPKFGGITCLWAGTSAEGADLNGKYVIPWGRVGVPRSNDASLGEELWRWCEDQVIASA